MSERSRPYDEQGTAPTRIRLRQKTRIASELSSSAASVLPEISAQQTPLERAPAFDDEDTTARRMVCLMTVSHPQARHSSCGVELRAPDSFSREWLRDAVLDAFANPIFDDLFFIL